MRKFAKRWFFSFSFTFLVRVLKKKKKLIYKKFLSVRHVNIRLHPRIACQNLRIQVESRAWFIVLLYRAILAILCCNVFSLPRLFLQTSSYQPTINLTLVGVCWKVRSKTFAFFRLDKKIHSTPETRYSIQCRRIFSIQYRVLTSMTNNSAN